MLKLLVCVTCTLMCMLKFFNREPVRVNKHGEDVIVSPTDGTILDIITHNDGSYQIIIFLSIFDVHCQWFPISGIIKSIKHQNGTFAPAYILCKSKFNENSITSIRHEKHGVVKVKQIAGQIARRVIAYKRPGEYIQRGETLGKIVLSSRVDVFLPPNVNLAVRTNQKVSGNITKIGTFTKSDV